MPTCVGILGGFVFDDFPSRPRDIWVYSALSDAIGTAIMEIVIVDLSGDGAEIYSNSWNIVFQNRLTVVDASIHLAGVVFPAAGVYSVSMLIDGELIADRRIRVRAR